MARIENLDVRQQAAVAFIRQWEIAQAAGISPETLSRWMRQPLSKEHRDKIMEAIDTIKKNRRLTKG